MIEELLLVDFQNHRRLRLVLGRVTVIVGDNGTGKSAVLRALRWLMTNQPLGEGFVGRWRKAPFALVKAKIDGRWVARKKGKGVNKYFIDGKQLKAFNRKPPQAVSDLCNVTDLNFQRQHDGAFGLSLGSSDAAKLLNSVVNLSSIDASLKIAAGKVRTAKARVEVCQERLKEARAGRDANKWAAQLSSEIDEFEQRIAQMAVVRTECSRIDDLLAVMVRAYQGRDRAARLNRYAGRAADAGAVARSTAELVGRLEDTVQAISNARRRLRPVPGTAKLARVWGATKATAAEVSKIESFLFALEIQTYQRDQCQQKVGDLSKELSAMSRDQGKCPACGQSLPSGSRVASPTSTPRIQSQEAERRAVRSGIKRRPGSTSG